MKKNILLYFSFLLLFSCEKEKYEGQRKDKELVTTYCSSCHQLPTPELLDKKTWSKYVLPKMGAFLGIKSFKGVKYDNEKSFENSFLFPEKPVLTDKEWSSILRYFETLAPAKLPPQAQKNPLNLNLKNFQVKYLDKNITFPHTILTTYDPYVGKIYFGDAFKNKIYTVDRNYCIDDSIATAKAPVYLVFKENEKYVLTMGTFNPSDSKFGSLYKLTDKNKSEEILSELPRPIHTKFADLNNDGKEDILVCGFGFVTGAFEWFENKNNKYIKHILNPTPGAIKVEVKDFNNDKKPDLLVLMAQGNEGFDLYTNMGNGNFSIKRILTFPPSFGSNSFELIDFNKDGYDDIIASNGDNGDYPAVLKNYHGVRIYLNDGKNNFEEKYFYPINGIHKALARDFDNDGDLDIATIAYFADFDHLPEESFIYFENTGKKNLTFNTFGFSQYDKGRWITMDAEDFDKDGDVDIILGSCILQFYKVNKKFTEKWQKPMSPVLILENQINKKVK